MSTLICWPSRSVPQSERRFPRLNSGRILIGARAQCLWRPPSACWAKGILKNICTFLSSDRTAKAPLHSRHPEAMRKASWGTAACLMLWARFFLLLAMEQTEAASRVQCLNNYGFQGRRVDCQWHRHQALEGTLFYLNFSDTLGLSSDLICPLSASPGTSDHFNCSVHSEEGEFTENDEYQVILHGSSSSGENQTDVIFVAYKPRLHIQCDPPFDLQSKCSDHACRLSWKRPRACEEVLEDWQWELTFKAVQDPWEQAQRRVFVNSETWVHLEGFEFKSERDYVARMRCKTPEENHHYGSHWSPWSSCVTWTAQPGDWQHPDAPISFLICLGSLLLLLALAFALSKRVRSSCRTTIPTPAAFFQPLRLAPHGDFKGWAGLAPVPAVEAVSQLSFLQPPACAGPAKQRVSPPAEELRGAALEPEHPPGDYCTLGGGGEGAALMPAHWTTPPEARSAPPPGSLPFRGQGQPGALGGPLRDSSSSGEARPMRPLFFLGSKATGSVGNPEGHRCIASFSIDLK
ncbi:interleukin-9 receptor-like isoform X2 [Thamnophis elegans]|uniref:interleukin-9 receptor-like isoform X2 n=1 Tax=Thamnophis elegans TaxID=35005 RepID=UPI0013772457|nr:interleukin-9 receptor-like isoform X2 [Thamnophis elegans]